MRTLTATLVVAFLSSPAAAQSLETLRFSADAALLQALPQAIHPDLAQTREPVLQKPLTPLPMHPSRLAGPVIGKVVLSALMLLVTSISIALGESGTLPPVQAAWLPNLIFATLGIYLFYRRISGQPIYLILRRLLPSNG